MVAIEKGALGDPPLQLANVLTFWFSQVNEFNLKYSRNTQLCVNSIADWVLTLARQTSLEEKKKKRIQNQSVEAATSLIKTYLLQKPQQQHHH